MEGIETREDRERGCGWRKEGGLYFMSDGGGQVCYKLPVPLGICPTCGEGIKFSRGFTWIDADPLLGNKPCMPPAIGDCSDCALSNPQIGRAGLIWIGEQFYPTPLDFTREAARQGISRRIASVPREFKVGETWILLAHLKAVWNHCSTCKGAGRVKTYGFDFGGGQLQNALNVASVEVICPECEGERGSWTPGIFHLFRPQRIEYVVTGDESQAEIDAIRERGITPVEVVHVEDTPAPSPTRRPSR